MSNRRVSFPVIANYLFGFCSIIYAITESSRAFPQFFYLYVFSKVTFGLMGIGFGTYIYFRGTNDLNLALSMMVFVAYTLVFMWLVPLYEIAYLQTAIGSAFFRLRRRWIFPSIFGIGLIGIFVTYEWQSALQWALPPISKLDWQWVCTIFFVLTWLIQKFAIGVYRHEEDRILRFSLVGVETTKLIHDLKGLLGSPLLIIDDLKEKKKTLSQEQIEHQMTLLAQDMSHIQNVIKSIHRLVIQQDNLQSLNFNESIAGAVDLLQRRLQNVSLRLPEDRVLKAYPNRLHSVFFNLLLNSIEAFDRNKTPKPEIHMSWEGSKFYYRDNAGGFSFAERSSKGPEGGIGIAMLENDLRKMNARLKIRPEKNLTSFIIQFDD